MLDLITVVGDVQWSTDPIGNKLVAFDVRSGRSGQIQGIGTAAGRVIVMSYNGTLTALGAPS